MKKIYKASYELSVVFFTDCELGESVMRDEAWEWIKRQYVQNENCLADKLHTDESGRNYLVVSELTGLDDLPKGWSLDRLPWGEIEVCADECTIGGWFENQQEKLEKIESLKAEILKLTDELWAAHVSSNSLERAKLDAEARLATYITSQQLASL